ncbi:MAG: PKD-like family lipoprotein [Odoribacter sp.]
MMNIRNFKYIILLLFGSVFFQACLYEDLGSYNYREINNVDVDSVLTTNYYTMVADVDTLKITPKVEFLLDGKVADPNRYAYEWSLLASRASVNDKIIKIGDQKDLKWPVQLAAGTYFGYFKVIDKQAELTWTTNFFVKCASSTNSGWMVLCDVAGKTRVDVISPVSETRTVVVRNILKGSEYVGKPVGMNSVYVQDFMGTPETIIYGSNGTFSINLEDFTIYESSDYKYMFATGKSRIDIRSMAKTWNRSEAAKQATFVVDDLGDLYIKYHWEVGAMYGARRNVDPDDPTKFIRFAPFIGSRWGKSGDSGNGGTNTSVLLYDQDKCRFMELRDDDLPRTLKIKGNNLPWYDAETGGMEMIGMTNTYNSNSLTYCISFLKDPKDGKIYLYGANLKPNFKVTPVARDWFRFRNGTPATDKNTKCYTHHLLYNMAICASDNKVYRSEAWDNYDWKLYLDEDKGIEIPADEEIVDLKFHTLIGWIAYEKWETADQYNLVVATNKKLGTLDENGNMVTEENCGRVRIYNVPKSTEENSTKIAEYDNLGHIISLTYKERAK